ncbi:MAG: nuclear transport factor 2 family protein [Pirellulaceae bacterium]
MWWETRNAFRVAAPVLLVLACFSVGLAQPPANDEPREPAKAAKVDAKSDAKVDAKSDVEADHDALRALRAVAEQAINENNLDLLRPHMAEKFSVVTYTDREFTDFDEFKRRWEQTREDLLSGGSYTTKLNPELSEIHGDFAIARGRSENVLVTGDGTTYEFPSRWTAVMHKVNGQWKVVRAHSSLSPFDNPMLHATVSRWLLIVGAIAAVVGLLVGGIFGLLIGRRRKKSQ